MLQLKNFPILDLRAQKLRMRVSNDPSLMMLFVKAQMDTQTIGQTTKRFRDTNRDVRNTKGTFFTMSISSNRFWHCHPPKQMWEDAGGGACGTFIWQLSSDRRILVGILYRTLGHRRRWQKCNQQCRITTERVAWCHTNRGEGFGCGSP